MLKNRTSQKSAKRLGGGMVKIFQLLFLSLCMCFVHLATSSSYAMFAVGSGLAFFGFTIDAAMDEILTAIKDAKK